MCGIHGHGHDHDHEDDHDRLLDHRDCHGHGQQGRPLRIGIGGPVGSGKTALVEQLVPRLLAHGLETIVVTNDIVTTEDAEHVRRTLTGILEPERVVGVETGTCPHTAVREDPTMNLAALEELGARFPTARVALVESGGDNLTLTFSRRLVDYSIYVIDVAGGDKIPRKRGPGLIRSDLLVINKTDLAPYVGASLEVMARDSTIQREGRPFLFTNCRDGEGIDAVMEAILARVAVPA
ncbi:MAG: urease accessory protein UreG [Chloroflexota bacterium]